MKWIVAALALFTPAAAHAACSNGPVTVHPDATSDGSIGGIAAGQCGIEVTQICGNGRCLAFFDGLSGYVSVAGLDNVDQYAAPAAFSYRAVDAEGEVAFMGRKQPFTMDAQTDIRVEPAAGHVNLFLPDPFPQPIRMTSTGSSGWEATLPNWVGVPVPVALYLDRLGAAQARLELTADHQMLKMDGVLVLERGDAPKITAAQPEPQASGTQAAVATAPVGGECAALETQLRPILRGQKSDEKNALVMAMMQAGITSLSEADDAACAALGAALGR